MSKDLKRTKIAYDKEKAKKVIHLYSHNFFRT